MHIKYLPLVDGASMQEQQDTGEQCTAEQKTNGEETEESAEQNTVQQTSKDEETERANNAANDQPRWTQVRARILVLSPLRSAFVDCRDDKDELPAAEQG